MEYTNKKQKTQTELLVKYYIILYKKYSGWDYWQLTLQKINEFEDTAIQINTEQQQTSSDLIFV